MSLFASEAVSEPLCDGVDDDDDELECTIPESIELCFTCLHSFVASVILVIDGGCGGGMGRNLLSRFSVVSCGFFLMLDGNVLACKACCCGGGGGGGGRSSRFTGGLFFRRFRPVAGNETLCLLNPERSSTDCVLNTMTGGGGGGGEEPESLKKAPFGQRSLLRACPPAPAVSGTELAFESIE